MSETVASADKSRLPPLALQASGAVFWGVFFSVAPLAEVITMGFVIWLPILVWREVVRSRKHGFLPGFLVRAAVVSVLLTAAALAPVKYEDQWTVDGLKGNKVTFQELSEAMRITTPDEQKAVVIVLPSDRPSYRQALEAIHAQTGLRYRLGKCGNGATVLWGYAPMGRYSLERY